MCGVCDSGGMLCVVVYVHDDYEVNLLYCGVFFFFKQKTAYEI